MNRIQSLRKPLLCLLTVLAAALCLSAGFLLFSREGGKQIAQNAEVWSAELDSGESVPGIQVPGYGILYFVEGQSKQQMTLYNPEGNPCYFEFELYVDGQDEPVYTSDLVEPGKAITELILDEPIATGEHDLTVQINTYALENQARMNGSGVQTTLIVQ